MLGLEAKYDYTPRMYRRIVFAAAQAVSFQDAAEALAELGELKLLPKRIWRAAKRIGEERVEECRAGAAKYEQLPWPARRESPVEQVPRVACVQMDGGRFQERERISGEAGSKRRAGEPGESDSATHDDGFWREYQAGVLLSMVSQTHATGRSGCGAARLTDCSRPCKSGSRNWASRTKRKRGRREPKSPVPSTT